jgi:hypothetical protein
MTIEVCAIALLSGVISLMGCMKHTPVQRTESVTPSVQSAIDYISHHYRAPVHQVGTNEVAVVWEYGADKEFELMKAEVKRDFGVDVVCKVIE